MGNYGNVHSNKGIISHAALLRGLVSDQGKESVHSYFPLGISHQTDVIFLLFYFGNKFLLIS